MAHNLLVVDDNPVDLGRLEKLLSGAGYHVSTAANGVLALAAVKKKQTRSDPDGCEYA